MVPKISVVVPIYNVEKHLRKCLDSILLQTFPDFEVILVNDCSSDNSAVICEEYAQKDKRIKLIHNKQNKGSSLSRKTGFENSSGEYIYFVDSDDWVEHTILENLYHVASNENADLVCCDFFKDYTDKYEHVIHIIDTNNRINNLGLKGYAAMWVYLFRRDLCEKIEFPLYSMAEDRVITQQALFYSSKICKLPYPLYHYRINPDSMMRNLNEQKLLEHKENILLTINFLKNNLQDDFAEIESNVNDYVNSFKYSLVKKKNVPQDKSLYNFYPSYGFLKFIITKKWFKGVFESKARR